MIRAVLIYALVLAAAAFALEWLDYLRFTRRFAVEIYIVFIALAFAGLGVWVGAQLTSKPRTGAFAVNEAAARALGLTARERAVLDVLAAGQSNKQIARTLGISPNTVKTHVSNLYAKLSVERRTHAVEAARRLDLLP